MELDENLEKAEGISKTWKEHINGKIIENLKNAIKNKEGEQIQIDDMASVDSIENDIVNCEILDGSMIEIHKDKFSYEIEEGDIINLKLTYKDGKIIKTDILEKNEEEKALRLKMIQEKLSKIRNKKE